MSKKDASKQPFTVEWTDSDEQLRKLGAGSLMGIWGNLCYIFTSFPEATKITIIREQSDGTETRRKSETGPEQPPEGEVASAEGST